MILIWFGRYLYVWCRCPFNNLFCKYILVQLSLRNCLFLLSQLENVIGHISQSAVWLMHWTSFLVSRMISIVPSKGPTLPCLIRCSSSSAPYCVWFSPGESASILAVSHWSASLTAGAKSVLWTLYHVTPKTSSHSWWSAWLIIW